MSDIKLYKNESKKIIFYEIGANVGYSSLLISKILFNRGKVYSFEVEPTNYKTLCDNIILNKLENIVPLNIGIASKDSSIVKLNVAYLKNLKTCVSAYNKKQFNLFNNS